MSSSPDGTLEVDLAAEFKQAPAHDLVRLQPLRTVAAVLRENRSSVDHVVDVDIAARADLPEAEEPGEADVELLESIFVECLRGDQVDVDIRVARRGAAARPQVATQRGRDQ